MKLVWRSKNRFNNFKKLGKVNDINIPITLMGNMFPFLL